mgnify:FL=1
MITKGEKKYEITECKKYWKVSRLVGDGLTICINVDKEICKTKEALASYIKSSDIF